MDIEARLASFELSLAEYFHLYSIDLRSIGRDEKNDPCLPESEEEIDGLIKKYAGTCGGRISAEVKRIKRSLVFSELLDFRDSGYDITVVLVRDVALKLIGRSFDKYAVINNFASAGRTQRCITPTEAINLMVVDIEEKLSLLSEGLIDKRLVAKNNWHNSSVRQAIISDWNVQRGVNSSTGDFKGPGERWLL
jgi:hypothetical protein